MLCNDLALRSAAAGRALIENSSVTLRDGDLLALLCDPGERYARIAQERCSPSVFPLAHARLLDRALHNLKQLDEPTRSLAILLVVKWALRVQPMSMLRGTDAGAAHGGDLDRVSPRRLAHYLGARKLLTADAWRSLARDVNGGVFPGRGQAYQLDVFDFLRSVEGDVVYLDPPYPQTTSYEKEYAVLDDLLEGRTRPASGFSRSADLLGPLFAACEHIPVWMISLNNACLHLPEFLDLVRQCRPSVRAVEVPYAHLKSIASEVKNETNREFIVLATR